MCVCVCVIQNSENPHLPQLSHQGGLENFLLNLQEQKNVDELELPNKKNISFRGPQKKTTVNKNAGFFKRNIFVLVELFENFLSTGVFWISFWTPSNKKSNKTSYTAVFLSPPAERTLSNFIRQGRHVSK